MSLKRIQSKLSFTSSISKQSRTESYNDIDSISNADSATSNSVIADANVEETTSVAPAPAAPPISLTLQELKLVTQKMALDSLSQLRAGYSTRSSSQVQPATTNSQGCCLVQKVANRDENGYIQIPPVGFPALHRTGKKTKPQNAHRLVVLAYKSAEDISNLLEKLWHASHLCHEPTCIEPAHICVEPKDKNEDRKDCKNRLDIVTWIMGVKYVLKAKACPHSPPCIAAVEEREAVATM